MNFRQALNKLKRPAAGSPPENDRIALVTGALLPLLQDARQVEAIGKAAAEGELTGAQAAARIDRASPTARDVIRLLAADPVVRAWVAEFMEAPLTLREEGKTN